MQLSLNHPTDSLLIHACVLAPADGVAPDETGHDGNQRYRIKIADSWHKRSLIVTPQALEWWAIEDASALTQAHFQQLAERAPEVVILGTGTRTHFPPHAITQPLMHKRIGLEVMDTAAACRTYNILAGDGRIALAALIV